MLLCAKQTRPEALRLHCRESHLLSIHWKDSLAVQRGAAGCKGTANGLDSAKQDVLDSAEPCLPARLAWTLPPDVRMCASRSWQSVSAWRARAFQLSLRCPGSGTIVGLVCFDPPTNCVEYGSEP